MKIEKRRGVDILVDNAKLKFLFYCHEAGKTTYGLFFDRLIL
jgi:hypothetical protein